MTTLALNNATWDLILDGAGNIATRADSAARTQDVCSACRVFEGEVYYNSSLGVPYLSDVLGEEPNPDSLSAYYITAARTVAGVKDAHLNVTGVSLRGLEGVLYSSSTNNITFLNGVPTL